MEANLVKRACSLATEVQSELSLSYLIDDQSEYTIIAFSGTGTVKEWYSGDQNPFGDIPVDLNLFPSLRSIGNNRVAAVNAKFFQQFQNLLNKDIPVNNEVRFEDLLKDSELGSAVRRAVREDRRVVFTGYSSGGPIAILATVLFLQQNRIPAWCITFGSPLVGDQIFGHALRREVIGKENWAHYFQHFVNRYDLIPRILLSPASSVEGSLQTFLPCFSPIELDHIASIQGASSSFNNVLRDASSLTSSLASSLMGCTNSFLQTIANFDFSPYRPFGTYIFCTNKGSVMFSVKNPDAILQLLFYSLLENRETDTEIVLRSFQDHLQYGTINFPSDLGNENLVDLEDLLQRLPLSSMEIETFVNELGMNQRAILCLTAARESEKQKERNQKRIDDYQKQIVDGLSKLEEYKTWGENRKVGYYDAFMQQSEKRDFEANIKRLELIELWDEIKEMLKRYDLPDGFEGREEWIQLGTRYRRLVEPLDIANYYRHPRYEKTGHYMLGKEGKEPRPNRYRYTQRWLEYAERKPLDHFSESCFWAEVECLLRSPGTDQVDKIKDLDQKVSRWHPGNDVFFEGTTFVTWWLKLSPELRSNAPEIAQLMQNMGRQPAPSLH